MAGPLSKFIGRDRDGNPCECKVSTPVVKSEPDKFVVSAPGMPDLTIKAWSIVRYNQEMSQLDTIIREANAELTAIARRKEKLLNGLDKAKIAAIMAEVATLSAGLKLPEPETIEEPDDET